MMTVVVVMVLRRGDEMEGVHLKVGSLGNRDEKMDVRSYIYGKDWDDERG